MHTHSISPPLKEWILSRPAQTFQAKGPYILFGIYAVALHAQAQAIDFIPLALGALCVLWGMIQLAYLLHDYYDKAQDQCAHKINFFLLPISAKTKGLVGLWGLLAISLPWLYLSSNTTTYLLFVVQIGLLFTYSCRPFRLKQHIILAPLWDSLYAYVWPVFTATYVIGISIASLLPPRWLISMSLWMLFLGLRHYINHIALDASSDRYGQHRTLATQYNSARLRILNARYLLPAEIICLLSCLWLMFHTTFHTQTMVIASIGIALTNRYFWNRYAWRGILSPASYRFTHIPWDELTRSIPLLLLALMTLKQPLYASLFVLHLFLFYPNKTPKYAYQLLHSLTAKWVNYSIYYFRRYLMGQSQAQARKAHYAAYVVQKERHHKKQTKGCVAIANFHRDKYTETFVRGPVRELVQGVHYLYGSPIPRYRDEGKPLGGSSSKQSDEEALVRFLIRSRIRAVLAHFGPLGVHIAPACKAAGVPLMVYFHGYDVFNQNTLDKYKKHYADLFRYTSRILCASRAIQHRLKQWGVAADKLFYMPPYVNVSLFPYRNHRLCPPHFLFVGRFCETKRPHLVLLAFQALWRRFPEARLTMIGNGGGGELFESSVILAHTLGIAERVHFHGTGTHAAVADAMKKSRALLVPSWESPISGDHEGTPVAALEAASAGLPIITTPHAGLKEIFQNETNALVVPPDDPKAWAQAMQRLMVDDTLVERIGQAAAYDIRPLIQQHTFRLSEHFQMAIHVN